MLEPKPITIFSFLPSEGKNLTALSLVSPGFCNLFRSFVQPLLVSRQPNYLDRCKPFRCIRGRITQRRQLAHTHQNLNIAFGEAA